MSVLRFVIVPAPSRPRSSLASTDLVDKRSKPVGSHRNDISTT